MGNDTTSRRVDRQPETEADKRFFDERESGYTGPLDQDGYRVTDPETLATLKALDDLSERQAAIQQDTDEA